MFGLTLLLYDTTLRNLSDLDSDPKLKILGWDITTNPGLHPITYTHDMIKLLGLLNIVAAAMRLENCESPYALNPSHSLQ